MVSKHILPAAAIAAAAISAVAATAAAVAAVAVASVVVAARVAAADGTPHTPRRRRLGHGGGGRGKSLLPKDAAACRPAARAARRSRAD
eukprot:364272-Chlamydomonas_euryale.AAC.10